MAAALLSSAVFAALLLSPLDAGADLVTWRKCIKKVEDYRGHVREASPDSEATSLSLIDCNLTQVRSGDFDGLPNLVFIGLDNNFIAHVDPAAFRTVPKLWTLALINNRLREVPVFDEHSFCPSLHKLYLYNNRISAINHPKTFSGCTELMLLHIYNNVIEYIHPDVFRPLSKLTELDLANNKITTIPETLFIKNNKLNSLILDSNKISYLPSDFVSKLSSAGVHLEVFLFNENPWHCACLLELLADYKKTSAGHIRYTADRSRSVCVYYGAYPCSRQVPTGLLRRAGHGH